MARRSIEPPKPKISPEFAQRLAQLAPGAMVRAIVLLDTSPVPAAAPRRPSYAAPEAIADAVRTAAAPGLAEVDRRLEDSGGRRLAPRPDLFGSVLVEAPASGLLSLAESEHVRALLEDQPVSLLRDPDR